MFIPKETIELVRERTNIVEIIKRYVPSLKQKGTNYIGLCPFHKEKTPSFTVSLDKKIFHCFGCNAGGNIFNFIQQMERLEFTESVLFLADIIGVEVKNRSIDKEEYTRRSEFLRLNLYAVNVYSKYLSAPEGKLGMEYLKKRGINRSSIELFKIGYAPNSWNFLTNKLKGVDANLSYAKSIGLINSKETDESHYHYYDKYRDRIIFPIFDKSNSPIGFGGRIISDEMPKYINSSESELFHKREILYGFNLAKNEIKDLDRAIIVEGYLDVIGCYEAGIKNVVAPLGTALTEKQVKLLSHYCNEVIILFDSDSAGLNAALKSIDLVETINVEVKVAILPESDPFDFLKKKGVRDLMVIIDTALKPVEFRISQIMSDNKGRVDKLLDLFSVISDLSFETERSFYLKKISGLLYIDENSIRKDFYNYLSKGSINKKLYAEDKSNNQKNGFLSKSYKDLIILLVNYPNLIELASIDFVNYFESMGDFTRRFIEKLSELYFSDDSFSIDKIFDYFENGKEIDFLSRIIKDEHKFDDPKSAYTEIYLNIKMYYIDLDIDKYSDLYLKGMHEYGIEIELLRREKEKLKQYVYNI